MTTIPNDPSNAEPPEPAITEPAAVLSEVDDAASTTTESEHASDASSATTLGEEPTHRFRSHAEVIVFGAGISGLTVAHELVIRDFNVTVIESEMMPVVAGMVPPLDDDEPAGTHYEGLAIGGLAASQYHYGSRHASVFPHGEHARPTGAPLVGEHGYRFFPSYYQHLFDTMQRTPLYDPDWKRTRFTTYDNIVACSTQATVGTREHPLLAIPRNPVGPPLVGDLGRVITEAGFRVTDVSYLGERMAQFMSSSSARRKIYENVSSYDFFVGIDKPGQTASIQYSTEADHELNYMPKVLAAFDGKYGDARTNIDNWAQMMLNFITQLPKVDGILNGPTSEAWLKHWRHLLGELGVNFVWGKLRSLEVVRGKTHAHVDYLSSPQQGFQNPPDDKPIRTPKVLSPDYIVVATDAVTAQKVTRRLPDAGVPAGLRGYTTSVPPRHPPGVSAREYDRHRDDPGFHPPRHRPAHKKLDRRNRHAPTRDPETSTGMEPWDRFQTLTGLQYYFDTEFDLVKGRVYYGNSEWGLSSVSQTAYWTKKPSLEVDGYHTIVSVDVGNATTKSRVTHKTFMESTADEIAVEAWRQMTEGLTVNHRHEQDTLPMPAWYTIDKKLRMGKHGVKKNKAPYLVPIVGDWDNRPGPEPWCPGGPSVPSPHQHRLANDGVWQAGHGGTWVHWENLVFAGTYLKTFTRLTTMESANESGRHAVNGILDHWIARNSHFRDRRSGTGLPWLVPYGYRGDFNSSPIRQPSPIGDYCLIVDMENNEVPALNPIRDLDAALVEKGLPHPFVLNGIQLNTSISSQIVALLSGEKTNYVPTSPAELLDKLRDYRRWLEHRLHEGRHRGHHGRDHGGHHGGHGGHHDRHDEHGHDHHRDDRWQWPGQPGGIDDLLGGSGITQALAALSELFGPNSRPRGF